MITTMHTTPPATSADGDEPAERALWERRFVFQEASPERDESPPATGQERYSIATEASEAWNDQP